MWLLRLVILVPTLAILALLSLHFLHVIETKQYEKYQNPSWEAGNKWWDYCTGIVADDNAELCISLKADYEKKYTKFGRWNGKTDKEIKSDIEAFYEKAHKSAEPKHEFDEEAFRRYQSQPKYDRKECNVFGGCRYYDEKGNILDLD